MNENTFADSTVNQHTDEKLTNANNFVFKDNQDFINYQKRFADIVRADSKPLDLGSDCGCVDEVPKFYSSKDCEQIKLTFMYQDAPYTVINNKAFFWEGYKNVVIQGARSGHSSKHSIPTIEVYNECAKDAQKYNDIKGNECHSYANDDAIFNIQNEHGSPANIVISDIAFRAAFNLADVIDPLGYNATDNPKDSTDGTVEFKSVEAEAGATNVVKNEGFLYERWYHPDICPVFFKVYEASSFKMFNVRMYSQYLDLTHVFLHWCENVDITNCEFKNYNARKIGGNIWICQRVKNVNIVNNDFYKYGNDENIGIWGDSIMSRDENSCYSSKDTLSGLDSDEYANRQLKFEHIHIKNNRFFYGKPDHPFNSTEETSPDRINLTEIHQAQLKKFGRQTEDEWGGVIDIFQSLYFSQHTPKPNIVLTRKSDLTGDTGSAVSGSATAKHTMGVSGAAANTNEECAIVPYVHYEVSDYVTSGNEFYIDSPMNVLMGVTFDNYCHTEGIKITNNLIKYGQWAHGECQLQDFKVVYDKNPDWEKTGYGLEMTNKKCLNPILIEDNTIESSAYPYIADKINEKEMACEYHIVLDVESGSVNFNRNTVNEDHREVNKTIENHKIINKQSEEIPFSTDLGYMLFYSRDKGGRISMRDNVFTGMSMMGSFDMSMATMPAEVELTASGNVFQGGTTFYSKKLQSGIFKFDGNQFFAEKFVVLLQEMPKHTQLVLCDNVIKRVSGSANGGEAANLYYSNLVEDGTPLPKRMTVISSGNKIENIKGCICPTYDGLDVKILSSNEQPIDSDFSAS